MADALVSIIIPVFNKEEQLSMCLESVLNQTYRNIEVILIDDGSTDSSGIICDQTAEKDSRVIIRHTKNSGVGNARNLGLELAQGEFIQFADADDYLDTRMTEILYSLITETDSDLVICGYHHVYGGKISCSVFPRNGQEMRLKDYYTLINQYRLDPVCGSPCNRLLRSRIIRENHLKYDVHATYAEDCKFNLMYIAHSSRFVSTSTCLYYYNMDVPNSLFKTTKDKIEDRWQQQCKFNSFFSEMMKENKMDQVFPFLAASIAFSHFYDSLNDRMKNGYHFDSVFHWICQVIKRKEIEPGKVRIDFTKVYPGQVTKKMLARDYKQKFLLFCVKYHIIGLYIASARLLFCISR